MGLLSEIVNRSLPNWPPDDDRWYSIPFVGGGDPSTAGPLVNTETSLNLSTVYACIQLLANTLAQLPCYLF